MWFGTGLCTLRKVELQSPQQLREGRTIKETKLPLRSRFFLVLSFLQKPLREAGLWMESKIGPGHLLCRIVKSGICPEGGQLESASITQLHASGTTSSSLYVRIDDQLALVRDFSWKIASIVGWDCNLRQTWH